jgi:undecaprenyl-diphosphatase
VAISRVVLGLHYPSDVLAGAALGALIALGALAL